VVAPGAVVTLTVVAIFFVGDALRDVLDVGSR
jgi:ABC-type dipeptide/oligopeptide/nickel transport system permease subunit